MLFGPSNRRPQLSQARSHSAMATTANRPPDLLSAEEWLALVSALGLSNREAEMVRSAFYDECVDHIACSLGISQHTVHSYRERLYRKLGVNSFCQVFAVCFATHITLERDRRMNK